MVSDERLGLVAREARERAGEHKGLARKAQILRGFRAGHVDACVFQAFDEVAGLPVREPALQELRGDLADVIHGGQLFDRGVHQRVHRAEALREHTRGLCADLADAKGAEQLGKIVLLGAVNGGDGVLRALEAHAVELCKRLYVETVKVGRLADKPGVHQLLEQRGADAVNVHRLARGEVCEVA